MENVPPYGDSTSAGARPKRFRWTQSPPVEDSEAFLPVSECAFGTWATAASRAFENKVLELLARAVLLPLTNDGPGGEPLCEGDRWLLEGFLANAVDGLDLPREAAMLLPYPGVALDPRFSERELDTLEAFGILAKCRGDVYDPANPVDLSAIVVRDFALVFEVPEERRPAGAAMSGAAHA